MVYAGRNPEDDFVVEPNRVGFATFGGCINVVDPYARTVRRATKKDCGDMIKVCDALNEISVATRSVNSTDVMEKAIEILENHRPCPLPGNASVEMDEILKAFEDQILHND